MSKLPEDFRKLAPGPTYGPPGLSANAWLAGAEALWTYLSEHAPEFDEKAFITWVNSHGDEKTGRWPTLMQCAAWQFERDKQRIALAE